MVRVVCVLVVVTVTVFVKEVVVCVLVVLISPWGHPRPLIRQQYSWNSSSTWITFQSLVSAQCAQHQSFFLSDHPFLHFLSPASHLKLYMARNSRVVVVTTIVVARVVVVIVVDVVRCEHPSCSMRQQ